MDLTAEIPAHTNSFAILAEEEQVQDQSRKHARPAGTTPARPFPVFPRMPLESDLQLDRLEKNQQKLFELFQSMIPNLATKSDVAELARTTEVLKQQNAALASRIQALETFHRPPNSDPAVAPTFARALAAQRLALIPANAAASSASDAAIPISQPPRQQTTAHTNSQAAHSASSHQNNAPPQQGKRKKRNNKPKSPPPLAALLQELESPPEVVKLLLKPEHPPTQQTTEVAGFTAVFPLTQTACRKPRLAISRLIHALTGIRVLSVSMVAWRKAEIFLDQRHLAEVLETLQANRITILDSLTTEAQVTRRAHMYLHAKFKALRLKALDGFSLALQHQLLQRAKELLPRVFPDNPSEQSHKRLTIKYDQSQLHPLLPSAANGAGPAAPQAMMEG